MQTVSIPIGQITVDPTLQPRVEGIDPQYVCQLEAVAEHWPPLKLVVRGERYLLVDGYHRYTAAKKLDLQTVPVEVLKVSETEDLLALAFALNAAHGRPLTLSDRRAFAARLLCSHPDWADREIGRRCGLVQPTIAKVRHELESRGAIPEAKSRIGRDGRSYPATPRAADTASLGTLVENLTDIFAPAEHRAQRRFVRYLDKLASSLNEQYSFEDFAAFENAAKACRAVFGDDKAKELAKSLGPASWNILQIAKSLGYIEPAQS